MDQQTIAKLSSYLLVSTSLAGSLAIFYLVIKQYRNPIKKDTAIVYKTVMTIVAAVLLSRLCFIGLALVMRAIAPELQGCSLEGLLVRWDANHYLRIAQEGYSASTVDDQHLLIVFYPFYPWLVRMLTVTGLKASTAGMILSTLALSGAAYFIYHMTCRHYDRDHGRRALKFLLIFPASVFLGLPFTESLFLLFSSLCLLLLMEEKWVWAGVCGGLSALTRNVGVLLVVPFLIEVLMAYGFLGKNGWQNVRKHWKKAVPALSASLLIVLGAGLYLVLNMKVYGDALAFLRVQKDHWQQGLSTPFKAYWGTLRAAVHYKVKSTRLHLWLPQGIMMTLVYLTLPLGIKRLRLSWAVYLFIYVIFAFSASWLLSGIRYTMGLAVLYPMLAVFTKKRWINVLLSIFFVLWALFMAVGYYGGQTVM